MTIITRTIILLTVFGWTYAACDARDAGAAEGNPCATADVARADASLLQAEGLLWRYRGARARALALYPVLVSAIERKRAALVACRDVELPSKVSPFEGDDSDPFAADEGDDSALAYAMTIDLVGGIAGVVRP